MAFDRLSVMVWSRVWDFCATRDARDVLAALSITAPSKAHRCLAHCSQVLITRHESRPCGLFASYVCGIIFGFYPLRKGLTIFRAMVTT